MASNTAKMRKEKRCRNCEESKPLRAYRADKYTFDGLTNWCNACRGEKESATKAKSGDAGEGKGAD